MKTKEEVVSCLSEAAFGKPLISNIYRGLVAEVIVSFALRESWKRCSDDWNGWDFENVDGCRLEVKQSAALQTWHTPEQKHSKCVFSIAPSSGFYSVSGEWTVDHGRKSSIYVFAHHPGTDRHLVDHRDPNQWVFYVVHAAELSDHRTISLSVLRNLAQSNAKSATVPCGIKDLGNLVEAVHQKVCPCDSQLTLTAE